MDIQTLTRMTTTSRDGTRIAYWAGGQGPALVLVHGTTADHSRWETVLPLLEPEATVYTMDRRGRGQSGDAADYRIEDEGADVAAVVDGGRRCHRRPGRRARSLLRRHVRAGGDDA